MIPKEFILYLVHFHGDRDYFECHEILEEYWKKNGEDKKSIWVGFILLAVSNYHFRRGNHNGALKTIKKAIIIFENQRKIGNTIGIEMETLISNLANREIHIKSGKSYASFNIPISNFKLLKICKDICKKKGLVWGSTSDLQQIELIHRHTLRDRSGIINERRKAKKEREDRE